MSVSIHCRMYKAHALLKFQMDILIYIFSLLIKDGTFNCFSLFFCYVIFKSEYHLSHSSMK